MALKNRPTAHRASNVKRINDETSFSISDKLIPNKPSSIPQEQWDLPAGLRPDGSFASLGEVVASPIPTAALEALPSQERTNLIIERLKQQTDYPTQFMLGAGKVNRERAIAEVQAQTSVGKVIQESEQRVINMMTSEALQAGPNK